MYLRHFTNCEDIPQPRHINLSRYSYCSDWLNINSFYSHLFVGNEVWPNWTTKLRWTKSINEMKRGEEDSCIINQTQSYSILLEMVDRQRLVNNDLLISFTWWHGWTTKQEPWASFVLQLNKIQSTIYFSSVHPFSQTQWSGRIIQNLMKVLERLWIGWSLSCWSDGRQNVIRIPTTKAV